MPSLTSSAVIKPAFLTSFRASSFLPFFLGGERPLSLRGGDKSSDANFRTFLGDERSPSSVPRPDFCLLGGDRSPRFADSWFFPLRSGERSLGSSGSCRVRRRGGERSLGSSESYRVRRRGGERSLGSSKSCVLFYMVEKGL
jgi:hypothetical protein